VPYSEYANAVAGSSATITDNAATSPEGVQNAARFLPTSTFGRWESKNFGSSITNGTTYVASAYFNTSSTLDIVTFYIGWDAATGSYRVGITFNPNTRAYISTYSTGSATLTDYDIGEADENGWYRVSLIIPATNANSNTCLVLRDLNSQADGSKYVDFYGWQVEEGSYPTSYIPTYGVSQTRLADDLELPSLSSVFDSSGDYTILFEVERLAATNESQFLYIRSSSFNYITLTATSGGKCEIVLFDGATGASALTPTNSFVTGNSIKIAVKISGNNCSAFANGAELTLSRADTIPRGFDRYQNNRNHRKYQEVYFPTALSDEACIELTTI